MEITEKLIRELKNCIENLKKIEKKKKCNLIDKLLNTLIEKKTSNEKRDFLIGNFLMALTGDILLDELGEAEVNLTSQVASGNNEYKQLREARNYFDNSIEANINIRDSAEKVIADIKSPYFTSIKEEQSPDKVNVRISRAGRSIF